MNKDSGKTSILYIDDDEDEYIILKYYLTGLSDIYELVWVSSFEEGITHLDNEKYDICILDYRLGTSSGIDLISTVRSRGQNIPILFLSGQDDPDIELKAIETGATDFLDKSELNTQTIERAIQNCLHKNNSGEPKDSSAYYDPLTALPGKTLFLDRLSIALLSARRYNRILALLTVNIDDFHRINSRYGPETGDMLLKLTSKKLLSITRGEKLRGKLNWQSDIDTVARLDGDTFAVLLPEISYPENAAFVADRIEQALAKIPEINGHMISITASIGIAIHPEDSSTINSLLAKANEALSAAKENGKNCFFYHHSKTDRNAKERLVFYKDLAGAIKEDKLFLVYQPVLNSSGSKIHMIEAFLRWDHPEKGVLPASDFIHLITNESLSLQLEKLVFAKLAAFHEANASLSGSGIKLNINVSPLQLRDAAFTVRFGNFLKKNNINPEGIVLDISQEDITKNKNRIMALRETRALISIDDFGNSETSLAQLSGVPFEYIKIDSCIIRNLPDREYAAIAAGITALGNYLDITVIAENVENTAQKDLLETLGCTMVQGDLFYSPLPENLLVQILKSEQKTHKENIDGL
ncbi:MAG: EAL domain-containing protein [Spirochaetales bacterium]|nr:EAL domain-containing protein [Spirochaetales bacterium]